MPLGSLSRATCRVHPFSIWLTSMKDDLIALAKHHVIRGREMVERQRQLVKELELDGHNTTDANTLNLFERTPAIFEEHLQELTRK
jgi:hypothetical protein